MEIIVVDNGSEDGSQEAVRKAFPEVKLIENEANLGFARANNIGIRQSNGRYVCLVNSDVKILDGCIDTLCGYMDQNPSAGIVGPKIFWPDMTLQDSCRQFPSLWTSLCTALKLDRLFPRSAFFAGEHMFYFAHDELRRVDFLAGCFLAIRRVALDQVGLFDEQFFIYAEEMDLCKRFWNAGWGIIFDPGAGAIHYHGASSSREPLRFSIEQQNAVLKYWRKHHSRPDRMAFVVILLFQHLLRAFFAILLYCLRTSERTTITSKIHKNFELIRSLFSNHRALANE
jgi:GT2 family glycosyltransferase